MTKRYENQHEKKQRGKRLPSESGNPSREKGRKPTDFHYKTILT